MYSVAVETKLPDVISYLNEEVQHEQAGVFWFTNQEEASKILARLMLYTLRQSLFDTLATQHHMDTHQREAFFLQLPSDRVVDVFQRIQEKISLFLPTQSLFHFEGFLHFRLKEEKQLLAHTLHDAMDSFLSRDYPTSNLDTLQAMMHEQTTQEEQLHVIIEPTKRLVLRSDASIYVNEPLHNEDMILSHLILLAPTRVFVHETHGSLTKETVIILRHLFEDKVVFTREKYRTHRQSKE